MPPTGSAAPPSTDPEPGVGSTLAHQVLTGTLANYGGQFVALGVWFFLTPFILHSIGATQYGLWVLVASVMAYGRVFDFGIIDAVIKYVAEHRAREDDKTASELVATALVMYLVIGLLVLVIGVLLAPAIVGIFNVPAGEQDTAVALVRITALGLALELPAGTAFGVLLGLQRFDITNMISSAATLTLAGAIVTVLVLGGGVLAMAAVTIPLTLFWQIPALMAIRRIAPGLRFGVRGARRKHLRSVTVFGTSLFGLNVAETVTVRSSEIVIGASLPVAALAPFSVARRLSALPESLALPFAQVLMPLSSRLDAEGEHGMLRGMYLTSSRITLGLYLTVGVPMAVFAGPLLTAWVGERYAKDADVLQILVLAGLARAALFPGLLMFQGMNRHKPLVVFALGSAALNVALALALVHPYGVSGVAVAMLIAMGVEMLVAVPYALSVNELPWSRFALGAVLPALGAGVPAAALAMVLREGLGPSSLVTIAMASGAVALTYAAAFLAMPQAGSERALVGRGLRSVREGRAAS